MLDITIDPNHNLFTCHEQFNVSFEYVKRIFRLDGVHIHEQLRELSQEYTKDGFAWGFRQIKGVVQFGYFASVEVYKTAEEIASEYEKQEFESLSVYPVGMDAFIDSFQAKS